jgi:hypothetical protein
MDLTVGGFGGSFQNVLNKMQLLQEEGVTISQNAKGEWMVDPACVFVFHSLNAETTRTQVKRTRIENPDAFIQLNTECD